MYASGGEKASNNKAQFDWFQYLVKSLAKRKVAFMLPILYPLFFILYLLSSH